MKFKTIAAAASLFMGLAAAQQAAAAPAPQTFCVDASSYISNVADQASNAALEASVAGCAGAGPNAGLTGFVSNNITGAYTERLIVSLGSSGLVFSSTTVLDLNKFQFGSFDVSSGFGNGTGLETNYNLYAVVTASGNVSGSSFTATTSTVNVFLDPTLDTIVGDSPFTPAVNDVFGAFPGLNFVGAGQGNDINLGSASLLQVANGTLGSSGGDDGFTVQFGDFTPTAAGSGFFIAPNPFYVVLNSDGDISNGFTVTAPVQLDLIGEANVIFAVPEPTSAAVVGLALVGLGLSRRRSAAKQG